MKKVLSLLLVVILCFSFTACGSGKMLNANEIEEALEDCGGILDMDGSGDSVSGITYTIGEMDTNVLSDKESYREVIDAILEENFYDLKYNEAKTFNILLAITSIRALLSEDEEKFNPDDFIEEILDIVCDGKTYQYNGWSISAEVDIKESRVIISAKS